MAGQYGDEEIRRRPWLAVLAAFKELEVGNTAAAGHYAELAERGSFQGPPPDGSVSFESERAMLRVLMARGGVEQMLVNASLAVEQEQDGPWGGLSLWLLATARQVNGDLEVVDGLLEKAVASARAYANSGSPTLSPGTGPLWLQISATGRRRPRSWMMPAR